MEAGPTAPEACTWCGTGVPADDGFRLTDTASGATAAFCRLEHVIPWLIKGARWDESREAPATTGAAAAPQTCAWCEAELPDERIELVRHRGRHRIPDAFCDLDHLGAWARAGGRFR